MLGYREVGRSANNLPIVMLGSPYSPSLDFQLWIRDRLHTHGFSFNL